MLVLLCGCTVLFADGGIVPQGVDITVSYQYRKPKEKKWQSGTVKLRDAVTEKAMLEELRRRNKDCIVRILAADAGADKVLTVRYKVFKNGKKGVNHTVVLTNALTQSMAKNQILAKNPDLEETPGVRVRIAAMIKKQSK